MTQTELIQEISRRSRVGEYTVQEVLNTFASVIPDVLLANEEVTLPRLGTFTLTSRKSMMGRNLLDGKDRVLEACTYPVFRTSESLKKRYKQLSSCHKS